MIFHQVGDAQGSRAADASCAMNQSPSLILSHGVDLIGYGVEEVINACGGVVQDGDVDVVNVWEVGVDHFHRGVNYGGDAISVEEKFVVGCLAIADEEAVGDAG